MASNDAYGCSLGRRFSQACAPPTRTREADDDRRRPAPRHRRRRARPHAASVTRTIDYRRIEREAFVELNAVRANPSAYAANLSVLLPLFNGKLIKKPGMTVSIRTNEGASAVREAISALQRQAPIRASRCRLE